MPLARDRDEGHDADADTMSQLFHRHSNIYSRLSIVALGVFAVGLGTAEEINPVALKKLTDDTGGYLLLTGTLGPDNLFRLSKYYLQILAGVSHERPGEDVRLLVRAERTNLGGRVLHVGVPGVDDHPLAADGELVQLTPNEFGLLRLLALNEGKLLTHQMILREVWGAAYQAESHYLHVYISQLRRKIERDPTRPRYILTERRVGYSFGAPVETVY